MSDEFEMWLKTKSLLYTPTAYESWQAATEAMQAKLDAQDKYIQELNKLVFVISQDETQPLFRREYAKGLLAECGVRE